MGQFAKTGQQGFAAFCRCMTSRDSSSHRDFGRNIVLNTRALDADPGGKVATTETTISAVAFVAPAGSHWDAYPGTFSGLLANRTAHSLSKALIKLNAVSSHAADKPTTERGRAATLRRRGR
jgi:hypothetical protein